MKKKFLSIFLAPLFVVPIALSSCSSSDDVDYTSRQTFIYKSQDYQLEIHPVIPEDYGPCTMADISVVFTKRYDTINYNDQIYIGSLTINDKYTNPNNGYTYKTNIVTFSNNKNQVLMADGSDANVEFVIDNFSVSANIFNPFFSLNVTDKPDATYDYWYSDWNGYSTPYPEYSKYKSTYKTNFSIRYPYIDVDVITSIGGQPGIYEIYGSISFSSRLTTIGAFTDFDWTSSTTIELPNSLKEISPYAFKNCNIEQDTFTIPQSVETIGDNAFAEMGTSNGTIKGVIKCPSKFQNDAERIFGNKDKQYSWENNTWDNYDIQFY